MTDERHEDRGPEARVNERAKWRRDLLVFGSVLCAAVFLYFVDRDNQRERTREEFASALYENCINDRDFREQYRTRAIVERRVATTQKKANKALIVVSHRFGGPALTNLAFVLRELNDDLTTARNLIQVVAIPDCGAQREALLKKLNDD